MIKKDMPDTEPNFEGFYFRSSEAATRLHVSTRTVLRLIARGKLKAYRFGGQLFVRDVDLRAFIEASRVEVPEDQNVNA